MGLDSSKLIEIFWRNKFDMAIGSDEKTGKAKCAFCNGKSLIYKHVRFSSYHVCAPCSDTYTLKQARELLDFKSKATLVKKGDN